MRWSVQTFDWRYTQYEGLSYAYIFTPRWQQTQQIADQYVASKIPHLVYKQGSDLKPTL